MGLTDAVASINKRLGGGASCRRRLLASRPWPWRAPLRKAYAHKWCIGKRKLLVCSPGPIDPDSERTRRWGLVPSHRRLVEFIWLAPTPRETLPWRNDGQCRRRTWHGKVRPTPLDARDINWNRTLKKKRNLKAPTRAFSSCPARPMAPMLWWLHADVGLRPLVATSVQKALHSPASSHGRPHSANTAITRSRRVHATQRHRKCEGTCGSGGRDLCGVPAR